MKIKILTTVFYIALLNPSCSTVKYTHSQVMNMAVSNQTKAGILNNFGIPTEKRAEGSYEEWFYDLGQRIISVGIPSTSNTYIRVNPAYNNATVNTNIYGGGAISRTYNDFIKITFQNERATKWQTSGVDYTVKESKPIATALLVIFGSAATIGLGIFIGLMGP